VRGHGGGEGDAVKRRVDVSAFPNKDGEILVILTTYPGWSTYVLSPAEAQLLAAQLLAACSLAKAASTAQADDPKPEGQP
jgi:hypothetical protein